MSALPELDTRPIMTNRQPVVGAAISNSLDSSQSLPDAEQITDFPERPERNKKRDKDIAGTPATIRAESRVALYDFTSHLMEASGVASSPRAPTFLKELQLNMTSGMLSSRAITSARIALADGNVDIQKSNHSKKNDGEKETRVNTTMSSIEARADTYQFNPDADIDNDKKQPESRDNSPASEQTVTSASSATSTCGINSSIRRESANPNVIGLDRQVKLPHGCSYFYGTRSSRGLMHGFFPPVKLTRNITDLNLPLTTAWEPAPKHTNKEKASTISVELTPESLSGKGSVCDAGVSEAPVPDTHTCTSSPTKKNVAPDFNPKQSHIGTTKKNRGKSSRAPTAGSIASSHAASKKASLSPAAYPYVVENPEQYYSELTQLPKPRMLISRDSPWVFRYKVKRNMNELSKVMASKPQKEAIQWSYFR